MSSAPAYVVERFPERSQTFVQNELRGLARRGIVPTIYALYPHADLDDEAGDIGFEALPSARADRRRLLAALGRVGRRHPIGLARAAGLAAARPSAFQLHCLGKAVLLADLVAPDPPAWFHAHFARASASVAMLAAAITGVQFSFTAHGADLFRQPFDLDRKLGRAAVTVTVCEYNRRWIEAGWPSHRPPAVVPCGVDTDRFARSNPYPTEGFHIVAVGRLVPKKGFTDLVRACQRLLERHVAFDCTIVGGGPLEAELEDLVRDLELTPAIRLARSLPAREVKQLLESASVLCLPAVIAPDGDRDSQPVVLKEAMAMEIPVVATREVGIPELVDEEVGRIVPPGDPDALAGTLELLAAASAASRATMGRAGRARVRRCFSLDGQVDGLIAVWEAAGLPVGQLTMM